jgi:hypothetical protein
MGRFPKVEEYPEAVVDFVRRAVEPAEGTVLPVVADKTAKTHRTLVRRRLKARYAPGRALTVAEEAVTGWKPEHAPGQATAIPPDETHPLPADHPERDARRIRSTMANLNEAGSEPNPVEDGRPAAHRFVR